MNTVSNYAMSARPLPPPSPPTPRTISQLICIKAVGCFFNVFARSFEMGYTMVRVVES